MKPFAWYDDGTCRAGSEATAHRVVTDEQKSGMHTSTAKSFNNPLYTASSLADAQAEIERLRGALETIVRSHHDPATLDLPPHLIAQYALR